MAGGFAAAAGVWWLSIEAENARLRQDFETRTAERLTALQSSLLAHMAIVDAAAALFDSSEVVTRQEFQIFSRTLNVERYGLQRVSWVPRVPARARRDMETTARKEGFGDYEIWERDALGNRISAGEREEYFPFNFLYPLAGNEALLGFDLASDYARADALAEARDSGSLTTTLRLTPVRKVPQYAVNLIRPLYEKGAVPDTVVARRQSLSGFVIGTLWIGDLVMRSLGDLAGGDKFFLFDLSAPAQFQLLYAPPDSPAEVTPDDVSREFHWKAKFQFGTHEWMAVLRPADGYLKTWPPTSGWFMALATLSLALLLAGYLRRQEQLVAAKARFDQVLEMAPAAVVAVDENQRIIIFNAAAEALFGYRDSEVIGQPLDLLLPPRFIAAHRDHIANFAQSPEVSRKMNERGELYGRRKNGEEFSAEAAISKLTGNGATTFIAALRDVTERKRTEKTLRQLSRAIEQTASLVYVINLEGKIEYVNPQFLEVTGYSKDEVIGQSTLLWKTGRMSREDYANLWKTLTAGRNWYGEYEIKRKDESVITVQSTISPIRDDKGQITQFVSVQEDISHRKELEEQLRRMQRMEAVGQLTGGLAHDFNNLLTVIIGNLDLLQDELKPNPKAQEMAQRALDAGLRGADLTKNLLAFARRQSLVPMVFDANELVHSTTELLRRTLGEQIEINTALSDNLWPAFADPTQVESALTNLALNARDAMPNGGLLTVETANKHLDDRYAAENIEVVPGDYVMLAVSDTGTGIPPEILGRVFEPFFTTKAQGKGTGLGLSMIYGFAKQSKGHVKIYSELGHGTTVRLYLPRAEADAIPKAQEATIEVGAPREATILVVEDSADVRKVVVGQLAEFGYRVIEAVDAASALEALKQEQSIDLLFTDIIMPGGKSGIDLAREARELRPTLKVLFTSGFAEAFLLLNNGKNGEIRANLLTKPYRKQDLTRRVREVLGGNGQA
jgi:PAS domain S-box-containing protein